MTDAWPPLALAGLGAFHGLNPAMGWLFAVALGLHRQSRAIVYASLLPIAVGHAVSIAAVAGLLVAAGSSSRTTSCASAPASSSSAGPPTTGASGTGTASASACARGSGASPPGRS